MGPIELPIIIAYFAFLMSWGLTIDALADTVLLSDEPVASHLPISALNLLVYTAGLMYVTY
jgi:hypothetical protein